MNKLTSFFYNKLPIQIQNLGISIFGIFWKKRRFGGEFNSYLSSYKKRELYKKNDWLNYQNKHLNKILIHAYKTTSYYNEVFNKAGLNMEIIKNIKMDDLKLLPFLLKDSLRKYGDNKMLAAKLELNGRFFSSSGSTGTPTKILFSEKMHQNWSAGFEARIRNWASIDNSMSRGTIGGRLITDKGNSTGPFHRYNYAEKQIYFSAYHISKKNTKNYLEAMYKYKIEYMTGYAMSNYFLARFIEEEGFIAPKLKAVITSSEKLTQEMRDTFKRVYGCKTYDSYSGVEACGLVSECEFGSLHISPDVGILEIIKPNGEYAEYGESGELVCTGLLNYDQPLIRYKIGDLLTLSKNQNCKCKREMPIVDEIIGRVEDIIIGKDGREIVRFHRIFYDLNSIIEAQVIQHQYDEFEIKLVTKNLLSEIEKKTILKRMESQLGKINLKIKRVRSIERVNGKFKSVISKVSRKKNEL